jgi:murein hydrolase activator
VAVFSRLPWPALALGALLAYYSIAAAAQSEEETARAQLSDLQQKIQRVTAEIATAQTRKNTLLEQLRKAELILGGLQRQIHDNEDGLQRAQQQLDELFTRRDELARARDEQQSLIAGELDMVYRMGRQSQVKILLNQEDPHTLARTLTYYRYVFDARQQNIEKYRNTLIQLETLAQDITRTTTLLENTRSTLGRQRSDLEQAQKNRELALGRLTADIRSKGGELKQMEQNRQQLERLLEVIEEAVVNLSVPENFKPFVDARGDMPWPIAGKPSNRFGMQRNAGKMRWQGITIPSEAGATVTAIHHGRVVYADWFRGSGLLLIIDHGNDYMSLYAHNQTLLHEVGEWVTAGTPISTVGNSGGQGDAALYFEIRHKGKPTNPAIWCGG